MPPHRVVWHAPQKAWRLMRIVLLSLGLGLVGVFAGLAVPWLGTAAEGVRNCVFIIFANIQLVAFAVRVRFALRQGVYLRHSRAASVLGRGSGLQRLAKL